MVGDGGSSLKYFRTCPFQGTVYATLPKHFPYFKSGLVSTRMTSLYNKLHLNHYLNRFSRFPPHFLYGFSFRWLQLTPVKPGNIFVPKGHADGLFSRKKTPSNGWTCGGFGPEGGHCKFKVTKDSWS